MANKTDSTPVKIFFCYARKDKALRDKLENHLEPLRRSGQVTIWHDREIRPGGEWKKEIDRHLNLSDIILLLISAHFMRSDYCYSIEMQRALDRHKNGEAHVIPIILSPVQWKETPIAELQALPRDGKPITLWYNRDSAFKDVTEGIRDVVETLLNRPSQQTDSAQLTVSLVGSYQHQEEYIEIFFQVTNRGDSPVSQVHVSFEESNDFEIIGSTECKLETIPAFQPANVHFTLRPRASDSFSLQTITTYTDVNKLNKITENSDRLDVKKFCPFREIPNRYVCGLPIWSENMFYGHKADIMLLSQQLTSRTTTNANRVVMLIGPRRSGKTSLIYQLSKRLNPHIPVLIDFQALALLRDTNEFLMHLVRAIGNTLEERGVDLQRLGEQISSNNPEQLLNRYLELIKQQLYGVRLILLLDEFEEVDLMIQRKQLNPDFLEYLRSLMLHHSGFNLLLAGTPYVLANALKDRSGFFNLAHLHKISKLQHDEAERLIVEPVQKFLIYDTFALERIHNLTGNQPYLIQVFCSELIQYCNQKRKPYVTYNDVDDVLKIVLEEYSTNFRWVWEQSTSNERFLLALMAQGTDDEERERSFSLLNLKTMFNEQNIPLSQDQTQKVLEHLVEEEIIEKLIEKPLYTISIGLFRLWLRKNHPLKAL